ncbi:MAG: DnaB-like helicase C-terminal domain-containing protein [Clostridia bacterium]|jgi:replicative DNA helicase
MTTEDIVQFERKFIYLLLEHKELVSDWLDSNLNKQFFSKRHIFLLNEIEKSFLSNVRLTRRSFLESTKYMKTPKERVEQENIFNDCKMSVATIDEFPFLMKKIIEGYLIQQSSSNIEIFNKNLRKNGISKALYELVDNLQNIILDEDNPEKKVIYSDILELSRERYDYLKKVQSGEIKVPPRILTGIKELDDIFGTGLAPGTLSLVISDTGGYKTAMMANIALNVWEAGYNVLFVPIEMDYKQMIYRIWARQGKVSSSKILQMNLNEEEIAIIDNINKKFESAENKFFLLQRPSSITVSNIQKIVEKNLDIFKPNLVVIDYIDNLDVEKEKNGRHDLEISEMLHKLRTVGRDVGFAVLSGAQIGRPALNRLRKVGSSKDGNSVNSEDIRGAQAFATDSDFVWAQMPNATQETSLLDILIVKNRTGPKIFSNNSVKTSLELYPDYYLIKSAQDIDLSEDGIYDKVVMMESTENTNINDSSSENFIENDDLDCIPGFDDSGIDEILET